MGIFSSSLGFFEIACIFGYFFHTRSSTLNISGKFLTIAVVANAIKNLSKKIGLYDYMACLVPEHFGLSSII